jgi:hypothetical protein
MAEVTDRTDPTSATPDVDRLISELVAATGADHDLELLGDVVRAALSLGYGDVAKLDLKIVGAAVAEMARAFKMFAPYHDVPKITMFGSARTASTDAHYTQAREMAHRLAAAGWMVVTGAGPGIMQAGMEGAGTAMAIGVNIRLPFEQGANATIAHDPKLVDMRYFFTRKLMLIKESAGFVVLPGGFGTLDETFELLTLLQTGKAEPCPIVMLDTPGETYWSAWEEFVSTAVIGRQLAHADDRSLYRITDDVDHAVQEILGFYRNYDSRRFVGNRMVLRLRLGVTDEELARLGRDFADICVHGTIHRTRPLPPERADKDRLDLDRIAFEFDRLHHGRLRELIDAVNNCVGPSPKAHRPTARA